MFGRDDDYDFFPYAHGSLYGRLFLDRVSPHEFLKAAKSGDENTVKQYIMANDGAYNTKLFCKMMDVSKMGGNTALHIAAKNGHLNVVNLLLQSTIDVNARGSSGNSALHNAVSESHLEVVKALLADERVITSPLNEYMETPVQIAVRMGNNNIAKALLEAGAFSSQYEYLQQIIDMEVLTNTDKLENCSEKDKVLNQLFLRLSIELRDLLVLHKGRFDFRKELSDAGVKLSNAAIRNIHTMSPEEFANVKEMAEFVKNSGEFNPEAVAAAFSAPRM